MKRDIGTLKDYFRTGKKPTEEQFADWLDSYVHKDELDGVRFALAPRLNGGAPIERDGSVISTLEIEIVEGWDFLLRKMESGHKVCLELLRWKPRGTSKPVIGFSDGRPVHGAKVRRAAKWAFEKRPDTSKRNNRLAVSKKDDSYDFFLEKYMTGAGKKYRYGEQFFFRYMVFGIRICIESEIGMERTGVLLRFRANQQAMFEPRDPRRPFDEGGRVGLALM